MTAQIDPGPGHRLLEVGERRPAGYETYDGSGTCDWVSGALVGYDVAPNTPPCRVKLPAPTDPPEHDDHLSTAIGYLDTAASEMRDRATSYDSQDGERSMGKAVAALNAIAGDDMARNGVRECHGWLLLELVKHVRQYANGPHQDSAVDSVAYAALHAEARMWEAHV